MRWMRHTVVLAAVLASLSGAAADDAAVDTLASTALTPHNPYDLSMAALVDTNDVFKSGGFSIWELPRAAWLVAARPLGRFTVYAEHTELLNRYYEFFTNEEGTFSVFPVVQLGGETGSGGGARVFHAGLGGRGYLFEGQFVYSGSTGQFGEAALTSPRFAGDKLRWDLEVEYIRTKSEEATINGAFDDDPTRRLRLDQVDVDWMLRWRSNGGNLAAYQKSTGIDAWTGYGRRDLREIRRAAGLADNPGMTPQARLLKGEGEKINLVWLGARIAFDDRDYKPPTRTITHPLNYQLPGRVLTVSNGLYHSFRDLGYPERGGLLSAEAELVTGSDKVRYYRAAAEVSRYFTLFWQNRILALRGRVEKVRSLGDSHWIPYTDLLTLGGNTSTRGYERGHFRGQGAILLSVEYRYPIWDTWNAFLFLDESHVFDHFKDIDTSGFRSSYGGGISMRTEYGLLGKIQFAHSKKEKLLIGFTAEQEF